MSYQELALTDDLSYTVPTKINENFRLRAFLNTSAQTATFTVWADDGTGSPKDIYLVTTGSSAITANLPAAGSAYLGRVVTIMKVDAGSGAVTIDGNASETINGATTVAIPATQFHYRTIMCDGSNWVVISSS
tara:strand:- start:680 stop:1078 length:399 start_codon:yes stop_codon:yes gene_type:complete